MLPATTQGCAGTRSPSDPRGRSLLTSCVNFSPFLLRLLKPLLKNNPVQHGRGRQRAGTAAVPLIIRRGARKILLCQSARPDKLLCDSSSAGESPPVADAGEITAGEGAADRPVFYYNTNQNSCFTTPDVGFKQRLGGPAPVFVRRGQSGTGTGAAGASPAWVPWASLGHPQAPRGPDWGILAGFLQAQDPVRAG